MIGRKRDTADAVAGSMQERDGSGHSQGRDGDGTRWSARPPTCCAKAASTPSGTAPSPVAPGCRWRRRRTTSPRWTTSSPRPSNTSARARPRQLRFARRRRCRGGGAAPSRRPTSWSTCWSGDEPGTRVSEQLISRYERYIACARQPGLRDIQRRIMKQRTDAVVEVVERSGRAVRAELLTALVCAVDGAVVAALVGDGDGPRATARATLDRRHRRAGAIRHRQGLTCAPAGY